MPCAGCLISPVVADGRLWPLSVPRDYHYCDVGWTEQAASCLKVAEDCRDKWRAGLDRERRRVDVLAARGDYRYRRMTPRERACTSLWCWRLSTAAIQLAKREEKCRERSRMYLSFAEFRRISMLGPS